MAEATGDFLELILRECAASSPEPWYPADYARNSGTSRDSLDPDLDRLRMSGLIRLTDWVQGKGQGYALTEEGQRTLQNPRLLALFQANKWSPARPALAVPRDPYALETRPTSRAEKVHAALDNTSRPAITYLLIIANVAVFVFGFGLAVESGVPANDYLGGGFLAGRNQQQLHEVQHRIGALTASDLVSGDWQSWLRLLTNCFVHFGLIHLLVNMYCLYAIGPFLEHIWGRTRFLVLYLISGCAGSCAMVVVNPVAFGAGASGAIWGILASLPVWIMLNRPFISQNWASDMMRRLLRLFILNVAISFLPGISAAAHFGGGAAGAVAAFLLNEERFGSGAGRFFAALGVLMLPVLCVGIVMKLQASDPRWARAAVGDLNQLQKRLDTTIKDVKRLYLDEIKPILTLGPGTVNEGTRTRLLGEMDERTRELKHLSAQLESIGPLEPEEAEKARRFFTQKVDELANLLELSQQCLHKGSECTEDELHAVEKQARRAGL
jgi:membrane associated rhomboid family serine protease